MDRARSILEEHLEVAERSRAELPQQVAELAHAVADRTIVVPSAVTARIQEMHITSIHAVCTLLDERLTPAGSG